MSDTNTSVTNATPKESRLTSVKVYEINIVKEKSIDGIKTYFQTPETISFKLKNASCALANLLRVFINYTPVKYLDTEPLHIISDQYVFVDKLLNRINQIPILQSVAVDTQVLLSGYNNGPIEIFLYSKDIKTKNGQSICINDSFRILELQPGKHIKINMKVKTTEVRFLKNDEVSLQHYNSFNKNFGITLMQTPLEYRILDFERVSIIHDNEVKEMFAPNIGSNTRGTRDNKTKTLFYTDKKYADIAKYFKKDSDKRSSEINKLDIFYDEVTFDKDLVTYTNEQIYPKEFSLKLKTYGNIDAKLLLHKSFINLITLYKNIKIIPEQLGYKIITYEHIAVFLYDRLKIIYPQLNIVMHIENIGYNNIIFYLDDGETLIKKTIMHIIEMLNDIKKYFE